MPRIQMAKPGTHYTEPDLSLSWGLNSKQSEVRSVDEDKMSDRLKIHMANGRLKTTTRPPTKQSEIEGPARRLLTGEAARKHRAIPAGPVFRDAFDARTGEMVRIPIVIPRLNEPTDNLEDEDETTEASQEPQATDETEESTDSGDDNGEGDDEPGDDMDLRSRKELQETAAELGISKAGNRADLIARIAESQA